MLRGRPDSNPDHPPPPPSWSEIPVDETWPEDLLEDPWSVDPEEEEEDQQWP